MDHKQLHAIASAIECEWLMGGLTDNIYEEFASEVAKRAIACVLEECASICDDSDDCEEAARRIRATCLPSYPQADTVAPVAEP